MTKAVKILIIGNGFGGVYALKNLEKAFRRDKKMKFAMIGEKNYFLFTPLLHEVATGSLSPGNITEPIRKVLGCCLDSFYLGRAEYVDLAKKTIKVRGTDITYDYLILAPGATTNFYDTPGAETYALPLKTIENAIRIKNHCISQMERAANEPDPEERRRMLRFVIVGGGPTGVEFAAELHELVSESFSRYYTCDILKDVSVTLIQRDSELVPQFNPKMRLKALGVLRKKGIEVMLGSTVKEIGVSYAMVNENMKIPTETVIWVAGIKPANIDFDQPVRQSPDGKIIVNEFLQIPDYPEVFAIGDIAAFTDKKTGRNLPALAQVAEKEGAAVAKNIKRILEGKSLHEFHYKSAGSLISLGQWMAVGEIGKFIFSGRFAWWLWRTIYLAKFISWRKKIRVAAEWTMNLFSPRDISEL